MGVSNVLLLIMQEASGVITHDCRIRDSWVFFTRRRQHVFHKTEAAFSSFRGPIPYEYGILKEREEGKGQEVGDPFTEKRSFSH